MTRNWKCMSEYQQWFQNKLATAGFWPAAWLYVASYSRPPSLQGLCCLSIVTAAYFSRVGRLLQNILKHLKKVSSILLFVSLVEKLTGLQWHLDKTNLYVPLQFNETLLRSSKQLLPVAQPLLNVILRFHRRLLDILSGHPGKLLKVQFYCFRFPAQQVWFYRILQMNA